MTYKMKGFSGFGDSPIKKKENGDNDSEHEDGINKKNLKNITKGMENMTTKEIGKVVERNPKNYNIRQARRLDKFGPSDIGLGADSTQAGLNILNKRFSKKK